MQCFCNAKGESFPMNRQFSALIILIFVLLAAYLYMPSYLSRSSHKEAVEITVPQGASLNFVANLLYEKNIIRSKFWFKYKSKEKSIDRNIKPGSYVIDKGLNLEEIFDLLQKGQAEISVIVTIPEGFTLYQIASRIEAAGLATIDEFVQATKQYFEENHGDFDTRDLYYEMEGYLYPDTYYLSPKQTVEEVISTLAQTMDRVFTEEYIKRAGEMNLSVHEVLTIASLIEREAYNDNERASIAGVIYNRLKKKMPLQIDATVIYGIGKGQDHISRVLTSHLEDPSPFNTYRIGGLPPGPIAAPSKASIEAALYPEDHGYFYYVMGEGGHVFNIKYEDHLKDRAKYLEKINKK